MIISLDEEKNFDKIQYLFHDKSPGEVMDTKDIPLDIIKEVYNKQVSNINLNSNNFYQNQEYAWLSTLSIPSQYDS